MDTELNSEEKTNTNAKNEDDCSDISKVESDTPDISEVKNNELRILNAKKEYIKNVIFIMSVSLAGFAYALIFTLGALLPDFSGISIPLAVFASLVTISFERNEWRIIRKHNLSLYDKFKPIAFSLCVLIIFILIFCRITSIPKYVVNVVPNFISAGTLLGYFISYTIRQLIMNRRMYKG